MNAGKTIEFFTKRAEELKPEEKPVAAAKVDQTVETKTDDTQKVESDKAEQPGEDGTAVSTVKEEVKAEKEAEEKTAAVTAKDVANMLATLAKNPTNTGVIAGAGLGSILSALGSISRSNDPKKKKSVVTNPALLGAVGAGTGYLGGNYLESIRPEDVQVAKEHVLQKVNRGLEVVNDKAKDLLSASGLKSVQSETLRDLKQTGKGVAKLLSTGFNSDVGSGIIGLAGLRGLAKGLAIQDRLAELERLNPAGYARLMHYARRTGLKDAIKVLGNNELKKKVGLVEKIRAIDPWSYKGKNWMQELARLTEMDGKLSNSATFRNTLQQEMALKKELDSLKKYINGAASGLSSKLSLGKAIQRQHQLASQIKALHALGLSRKVKALNVGSKALQVIGRMANVRKGLKGKAALLALLYPAARFGYKAVKEKEEAR